MKNGESMKMKYQFAILLFTSTFAFSQMPNTKALYLDGNGSYVQLFGNVITSGEFTIEVYANMFTQGGGSLGQQPIFQQRDDLTEDMGGKSAILFETENHFGGPYFALRDEFGNVTRVAAEYQSYGEWHHYAVVVDSDSISLYIDGVLHDQKKHYNTGNYTTSIDYIDIGRHRTKQNDLGFFHGLIDELRIWNYPRTAEQILATKADTLGPEYYLEPGSGLVAYWRFDKEEEFETDNSIFHGVRDYSVKAHHGAFQGDARIVSSEPVVHDLKPFRLLNPSYDATIKTTSPTLVWQAASEQRPIFPNEMEYKIFVDTNWSFLSPECYSVFNDTSYTIQFLESGHTYFWKVLAKNINGDSLWSSNTNAFFVSHAATGVEREAEALPDGFVLHQNYPNPFNPTTTIQFELPEAGHLELRIFDVIGRLVNAFIADYSQPGVYSCEWDGKDTSRNMVAAGVYIYHLNFKTASGKNYAMSRKMSLLK
jgi:hypothetical protein